MQNSIDTIGSLFLNKIQSQRNDSTDFSKLVLNKMKKFNFPHDSSIEHWNKVTGEDFNYMVRNNANTNSFFIVANRYFEISVIIINSKGNICVVNDTGTMNFSPYQKNIILYVYSKNKKKQNTNISLIRELQQKIESQKIKNVQKGKQLF